MKRRLVLAAVTSLMVLAVTSCSTVGGIRHEYVVRGQVISAAGKNVYLCVGKRGGAQVGQELAVNRVSLKPPANPKTGTPTFARTPVGRVKIAEIVDEHFAKAAVMSGDVQANDVAELERL
jgi:hypothetical protein